ncbi:hypothetical protein BV25DRAFT_1919971 [Artomyces pyxidatus]|uniref:Uncharacterized protein n=1 Tax=Artomyces pyxidatus TaxID=48021 RepID=A0ACB8SPD9_9AGAM|nr:hypothetical protein BV25DRAFT_1919971 [Artomyces pyxidatus]
MSTEKMQVDGDAVSTTHGVHAAPQPTTPARLWIFQKHMSGVITHRPSECAHCKVYTSHFSDGLLDAEPSLLQALDERTAFYQEATGQRDVVDMLRRENDNLKSETRKNTSRLAEDSAHVERVRNERNRALDTLDQLRRDHEELRRDYDELLADFNKLKSEYDQLSTHVDAAEHSRDDKRRKTPKGKERAIDDDPAAPPTWSDQVDNDAPMPDAYVTSEAMPSVATPAVMPAPSPDDVGVIPRGKVAMHVGNISTLIPVKRVTSDAAVGNMQQGLPIPLGVTPLGGRDGSFVGPDFPDTTTQVDSLFKAAGENIRAYTKVEHFLLAIRATPATSRTDAHKYAIAEWEANPVKRPPTNKKKDGTTTSKEVVARTKANSAATTSTTENVAGPSKTVTAQAVKRKTLPQVSKWDSPLELQEWLQHHRDPDQIRSTYRGTGFASGFPLRQCRGWVGVQRLSPGKVVLPGNKSARTPYSAFAARLLSEPGGYQQILTANGWGIHHERVITAFRPPSWAAEWTIEDIVRHYARCGVTVEETNDWAEWAVDFLHEYGEEFPGGNVPAGTNRLDDPAIVAVEELLARGDFTLPPGLPDTDPSSSAKGVPQREYPPDPPAGIVLPPPTVYDTGSTWGNADTSTSAETPAEPMQGVQSTPPASSSSSNTASGSRA